MKKKGNKNLTFTQRLQIEALVKTKQLTRQQIAYNVGISIATLYNELRRGQYEYIEKKNDFWTGTKIFKRKGYSAQIAHEKYKLACTARGRPIKLGNDYEFVHYIEKRVVQDKISLSAVYFEILRNKIEFKTKISKPTLYRYVELGIFDGVKLSVDRKEKYRKTKRMKIPPRGTSIERRPEEINNRASFGHWEMDCVCGKGKTTLLVLSERLTRKDIIFKMENQKAESVINCLNILERKYGNMFRKVFKSITMDNGTEFADYKGIERSIYNGQRTVTYYCHPYCSSERGTNERLNREIRRLIPKGSDLSRYTIEDIQRVEAWVNSYPRWCLNYATSDELFNEQIKLLG